MSPTENIYNTVENLPYYGPPGVGLNAGVITTMRISKYVIALKNCVQVIMMNLTRMRHMPGGGFTGSVRSYFYSYFFARHANAVK